MAIWNKILAVLVSIAGLSLLATAPLAKSIPSQYTVEIAEAEKLGRIIYEKDIAAWVGTDKMLEDLGQGVSGLPIRGWVTDKDGNRYRVNFIGEKDGETKIYYQVWTKGKQVKKSKTHMQGIALSDAQMAMWRARKDALKRLNSEEFLICSNSYNPVVLPTDTGIYVYLFAATMRHGVAVMGGHHRLLYAKNGKTYNSHISFTKSCLELNTKGVDDKKVVGLVVSNLMSAYPQEHHVYLNLSRELDLFVSASKVDLTYKVSNGIIKEYPEP